MPDTYAETRTGRRIDFLNPDPEQISLEDIAWSLSRIRRFNAHNALDCSVAVHSCMVALLAPKEVRVKAFVHDFHEYVTGDVNTTIKHLLPGWYDLEDRIQQAIYKRFDITPPTPEEQRLIDIADIQALKIEARAGMRSRGEGWDLPEVPAKPEDVEWMFDVASGEPAYNCFRYACLKILKVAVQTPYNHLATPNP